MKASSSYAYFFAILALFGLAFFSYLNSLDIGFLSDDFSNIRYIGLMTQVLPQLFWQNFVSSYAQDPCFGLHYRPLLQIFFLVDYGLWHTNPWGYHLSNIFYHAITASLVFLTTRRIYDDFNFSRSYLLALITAALFTVSPLHSEAICWIVGRVDPICTIFYLLSFCCFLKYKKTKYKQYYAAFLYLIALNIKEMAIPLAAVITTHCFFLDQINTGFFSKLKRAFISSQSFWYVLIFYLTCRYLALGEFFGGYIDSMHNNFLRTAPLRLFSFDTAKELIAPANLEWLSGAGQIQNGIIYMLAAAGLFFVISLIIDPVYKACLRFMFYCFICFAWSILPILRIWVPFSDLTVSRLLYLPDIWLSLGLTLILCQPFFSNIKISKIKIVLSTTLVGTLFCAYLYITVADSQPFLKNSQNLNQLLLDLKNKLKVLDSSKQIIVFDLLSSFQGGVSCHAYRNLCDALKLTDFQSQTKIAIASLDPRFGRKDEPINLSRFRQICQNQPAYDIYSWQAPELKLSSLTMPPADLSTSLEKNIQAIYRAENSSSGWISRQYSLNEPVWTIAYPLLRLDFDKVIAAKKANNILLWWKPKTQTGFSNSFSKNRVYINPKETKTIYLPLGEQLSWLTAGQIDALSVDMTDKALLASLSSVSLCPDSCLVPKLKASAKFMQEFGDGVYFPKTNKLIFDFDASMIPQASSVIVEVVGPLTHFADFTKTYRDNQLCPYDLQRFHVRGKSGSIELDPQAFEQPCWYQVRIMVSAPDGEIIGFSSDPVNFQLRKIGILSNY